MGFYTIVRGFILNAIEKQRICFILRLMTSRRISKEIRDLESGSTTSHFTIDLSKNDADSLHYQATLMGPIDSPFEGGIYQLDIHFHTSHPFKLPTIKFLTKIFHPNIDQFNVYCRLRTQTYGYRVTMLQQIFFYMITTNTHDVFVNIFLEN